MTRKRAIGVVAGSGVDLGSLLDRVAGVQGFGEVPGLVAGGVAGHPGRFVQGWCADVPIIVQCGRLHCYEGLTIDQVARPVDVLKAKGAHTVVFTNAAGGLHGHLAPGVLLAVERISLWPYRAWPDQPKTLALTMTLPGCDHKGAYLWVHGPSYETRAEIAAMGRLGNDAVGMSTAPEVCRAQEVGLRTAAVSCITNSCLAPGVLTHEHVITDAAKASRRLAEVIRTALPSLLPD